MDRPRERNAEQTRAAILAAARESFAADGFERTTIRAVAAAAGVDPALVMHYFRHKNGLFAAAAELTLDLPDLTGTPPDRIADALVPRFFAAWAPGGPFLGLLRSAATNPVAAQTLVAVFVEQVAPALAPVTRNRAAERAALVGSQLLGLAVARAILEVPPLVAMSERELIRWLRPVVAHYLTDPAPPAPRRAG